MSIVEALEKAVGNTEYGKFIVEDAKKAEAQKGEKYAQSELDRLDESIGVLKAYARIHAEAGKEAMATAEEDKIAIAEKARKAIEDLK